MIRIRMKTLSVIKKRIGRGEMDISLPEGSTLETLMDWMLERWRDVISRRELLPDGDTPIPHVRWLVNGRDIGFLNGMKTVLREGDEILIIPPMAGG